MDVFKWEYPWLLVYQVAVLFVHSECDHHVKCQWLEDRSSSFDHMLVYNHTFCSTSSPKCAIYMLQYSNNVTYEEKYEAICGNVRFFIQI